MKLWLEEAESVGTMSEPFTMEVIKGFPNSANSNVTQAAAKITIMKPYWISYWTEHICELESLYT